MYYIVGLGNPEDKYQDTPHNIGRQLVMGVGGSWGMFALNSTMQAYTAQRDDETVLVLPETYMNKSGEIFRHHKNVDPGQVVVVYDDIDLPFGVIKISRSRGDGGHNGIKSIEQQLGSRDFVRIRVGVCPTDWFGNARKPRGKDAVGSYLVHKKLSSRFTRQYTDLALQISRIIDSLKSQGYERTVSKTADFQLI